MKKPIFQQPPVGSAIFGHYVGMILIGNILLNLTPEQTLRKIHDLLVPSVSWIPNVSSLARLTPVPIFTETFLAISILLAQGIVVFFFIFLKKKYCTILYKNYAEKSLNLVLALLLMGSYLFIQGFLPYPESSHVGRAASFLKISSSTPLGVMVIMNAIGVSVSLALVLAVWSHICCTKAIRRAWK